MSDLLFNFEDDTKPQTVSNQQNLQQLLSNININKQKYEQNPTAFKPIDFENILNQITGHERLTDKQIYEFTQQVQLKHVYNYTIQSSSRNRQCQNKIKLYCDECDALLDNQVACSNCGADIVYSSTNSQKTKQEDQTKKFTRFLNLQFGTEHIPYFIQNYVNLALQDFSKKFIPTKKTIMVQFQFPCQFNVIFQKRTGIISKQICLTEFPQEVIQFPILSIIDFKNVLNSYRDNKIIKDNGFAAFEPRDIIFTNAIYQKIYGINIKEIEQTDAEFLLQKYMQFVELQKIDAMNDTLSMNKARKNKFVMNQVIQFMVNRYYNDKYKIISLNKTVNPDIKKLWSQIDK